MKKTPNLLDLYEAIRPYTIYCDMDGVLCNFDKGYEDLTGISTDEANKQSKSNFWGLFRSKLQEKNIKEKDFWANLEWQPGGKELWSYIQQYNPNILSAPSVDFNLPSDQRLSPEYNQAIQGKKEWISKNLSGVGKEIFVPAPQKATFSNSKSILIDDMEKNIQSWRASGGKAIHHTNTPETIQILKEKYKI
jgi:FMN phosphatase YigB (HAD superfamily)